MTLSSVQVPLHYQQVIETLTCMKILFYLQDDNGLFRRPKRKLTNAKSDLSGYSVCNFCSNIMVFKHSYVILKYQSGIHIITSRLVSVYILIQLPMFPKLFNVIGFNVHRNSIPDIIEYARVTTYLE